MSDDPDPERLAALEARIKALKGTEEGEAKTGDDAISQAGFAWQMVVELVVGLAFGFGIGFGLDSLFGTRPIFLVLFILLGFAAGVKVMLGTAAQMQRQQAERAAERKEKGRTRGD